MLVDSHCHLHDRQFFTAEQAEKMLARARENNVRRVVCIGTDVRDSMAAQEFAVSHEGVFWTFGIHPNEVDTMEGMMNVMMDLLSYSDDLAIAQKLIGIGEIGLDYHAEDYNRENQLSTFESALQLADSYELPVSFHVREAFDDFFGVIRNFPRVRGVVHSFTDSKKVLKRVLAETEFYVGVNGLSTYTTLPLPPLERILLETDAPFLTPKPFRGIINEPAYIRDIAEWLAEKTGEDFETIEKETTKNVERLFKFSDSVIR